MSEKSSKKKPRETKIKALIQQRKSKSLTRPKKPAKKLKKPANTRRTGKRTEKSETRRNNLKKSLKRQKRKTKRALPPQSEKRRKKNHHHSTEKLEKEPKESSPGGGSTDNHKEEKTDKPPSKKSKHVKGEKKHKKKFVESLPEDIGESSEEDEEGKGNDLPPGYFKIKGKSGKWKTYHCVLVGGSLYWYKTAQNVEPEGHIHLKGAKIRKGEGAPDQKWALEIVNDATTFSLILSSQVELDQWMEGLKKGTKLEQAPPPEKEKTKKQGRMQAAKKKIAGSAATSSFGKSVIKKVINDETAALLISIRKIVKKESSGKKADELEKNIIKLAVKSYLLTDRGKLKGDDFLVADGPLRDAFELLIKCFNGRGRVEPRVLSDAFKRVEGMLKKAETVITNLLAPHLTPKNMFRISSTFGYLANAEFLEKVFKDASLEEELEKLIDAMEYYTQFHY